MEFTFDNIKENLYIKYLNNLCNSCIKQSINYSYLQTIINELKKNESENIITIFENNTETDAMSEKIDYLYTKPWSKLNQIHKIIKIKEFINNLDITDLEKENLKDDLIKIIKEKTKKNKIIYDETKGKILSISTLTFNNGKYNIGN